MKYPYACKFKDPTKLEKSLALLIFSLYRLLHSQVYRNDLKLWISNVKFLLINERESNRKLPKMFAGKSLRMTQKKASRVDLIKKAGRSVLKTDA